MLVDSSASFDSSIAVRGWNGFSSRSSRSTWISEPSAGTAWKWVVFESVLGGWHGLLPIAVLLCCAPVRRVRGVQIACQQCGRRIRSDSGASRVRTAEGGSAKRRRPVPPVVSTVDAKYRSGIGLWAAARHESIGQLVFSARGRPLSFRRLSCNCVRAMEARLDGRAV